MEKSASDRPRVVWCGEDPKKSNGVPAAIKRCIMILWVAERLLFNRALFVRLAHALGLGAIWSVVRGAEVVE